MNHEEMLRRLKDLRDYHKRVDWTEPKHTQALDAAIEFIEDHLYGSADDYRRGER